MGVVIPPSIPVGLRFGADGYGCVFRGGIAYAVLPLNDLVNGSPSALTYAATRAAEEAAAQQDAWAAEQ